MVRSTHAEPVPFHLLRRYARPKPRAPELSTTLLSRTVGSPGRTPSRTAQASINRFVFDDETGGLYVLEADAAKGFVHVDCTNGLVYMILILRGAASRDTCPPITVSGIGLPTEE